METSPEHFSYKRDDNGPSRRPLPALIQTQKFVPNNSQNARVKRAKKAYQCTLYTPMRSPFASNSQLYL